MQVSPLALAKSRLGTPCVITPMLPIVVRAATEKLKVCGALVEPTATEPKFWLAAVPV